MIPERVGRWATKDVYDQYFPYLFYLEYLEEEIEKVHGEIHDFMEKESDRRLELIRQLYTSPKTRHYTTVNRPPKLSDLIDDVLEENK